MAKCYKCGKSEVAMKCICNDCTETPCNEIDKLIRQIALEKGMRKPRRRQILSRRAGSDIADIKGGIMSEAQIAVMKWAELQSNKYPEVKLLVPYKPTVKSKGREGCGVK